MKYWFVNGDRYNGIILNPLQLGYISSPNPTNRGELITQMLALGYGSISWPNGLIFHQKAT